MEVGRRRGRRNPQITMLAFIDLDERVPTAYHLARLSRLVRRRTEGPHGSLIHRIGFGSGRRLVVR